MWLFSFFYQEIISISPFLESGLVLQLAFMSRMWWQESDYVPVLSGLCCKWPRLCLFSLLEPSHLPWEQACSVLLDDERYLAVSPLLLQSPMNQRTCKWGHPPPAISQLAGPPADCTRISKPSSQRSDLAQINRTTQGICRPLSDNRRLLF